MSPKSRVRVRVQASPRITPSITAAIAAASSLPPGSSRVSISVLPVLRRPRETRFRTPGTRYTSRPIGRALVQDDQTVLVAGHRRVQELAGEQPAGVREHDESDAELAALGLVHGQAVGQRGAGSGSKCRSRPGRARGRVAGNRDRGAVVAVSGAAQAGSAESRSLGDIGADPGARGPSRGSARFRNSANRHELLCVSYAIVKQQVETCRLGRQRP